ncbi:MAG: hypothetical protein ACXU9Z_10840 [Gemmatimonadaceae bacterium]
MPRLPPPHPELASPPKTNSALLTDRALVALGGDPAFIADLLGDLSEEYKYRAAHDGVCAARLWYARELVRSAPHLVWNAIRHGTPAARARLAASILAVVVTFSVLTLAWLTRNGPPASLSVAGGIESDGIVVNNLGPVQLSMLVLDGRGHRLERTDVHYQRVSGAPILVVSTHGVIKCTRRGDAIVRASLATLNREFVIHCQPVREIRGVGWGNFMVGDSASTLTVDAISPDGQPVTRIAARLRVEDSTVATLDSSGRLRPLQPGKTWIDVEIGDRGAGAVVTVFEPVRTFEGLRPDQRWVVAPIRLTRGGLIRWPLPTGLFFLSFSADSSEVPAARGFEGSGSLLIRHSPISMSVTGPIMCIPELGPGVFDTHCLAREPGASVSLTYSGPGASHEIVGTLALERQEQH